MLSLSCLFCGRSRHESTTVPNQRHSSVYDQNTYELNDLDVQRVSPTICVMSFILQFTVNFLRLSLVCGLQSVVVVAEYLQIHVTFGSLFMCMHVALHAKIGSPVMHGQKERRQGRPA